MQVANEVLYVIQKAVWQARVLKRSEQSVFTVEGISADELKILSDTLTDWCHQSIGIMKSESYQAANSFLYITTAIMSLFSNFSFVI
jgi:hypothetical protein